ncbi:MAG: type 1 glutamine amidotransferase [Methylococcaceae bacterium]
MRIHYLQHLPFEGLSGMEPILKEKGHKLSSTHLYNNQSLPLVKDIDWLIVMGGSMNIYEEELYPWLSSEKQFIKEAINAGKIVLGICLGAQLIADALGAKIYKNKYQEIGWFNIIKSLEAENTILSTAIPEQTEVFHWHSETFDIPEGAITLAKSEACENQGFILLLLLCLSPAFSTLKIWVGSNRANQSIIGNYYCCLKPKCIPV